MTHNITLGRLAELAGVSPATVSIVLNRRPLSERVSQATRDRIFELAAKHHYAPNALAKAMQRQSTGMIGFICGEINRPFYAELCAELDLAAEKFGYRLLTMPTRWSFEKELEALEQLCSRSVDGVVIVSHVFSEKNIRTDRFRSDNIPLVAIADVKDSGVCSLNFDIAVSMDELFEHLTDNGLRRIAFVDYSVYPGKYEAYRDSTRKFGIKEEYYTDFADFADDYDRLVAQILQDLPEVIIAGSDWIGAELIHRFSAAGVAVPDQLAVATIDGTVLSATYNPPLTAIRSDIPMLAKTAIDIIVERIKGNTDLITKTIPTKLLIRQSTQKKGQKK